MKTPASIRILFLVLAPSGCLPSAPPLAGSASPSINEAAVLADVANGSYRSSAQFGAVSRAPYPSAISSTSNISVWVTAPDYASYARISPEQSGSGASVATGTLLVREVRDATGAVQKLTLMMKGAPGYNPEVGDFWFGVTQPDGSPMMDTGGARKLGKLAECFGCHIARASDGYLFGVPAADRAPIGGGADGGAIHPDGGVVPGGGAATDGGTGCANGHGHGGCAGADLGM